MATIEEQAKAYTCLIGQISSVRVHLSRLEERRDRYLAGSVKRVEIELEIAYTAQLLHILNCIRDAKMVPMS